MPDTYKVTLSDGRIVTLQADHAPSEAEVMQALGATTPPASQESFLSRNAPAIGGTVGGIAGGLIGGPAGAIGGAALGGAAGEGYRIQQAGQPIDPLTAGERMAVQGAGQGLVSGVSEGLGALAAPVARGMMKVGAGVTAKLAAEFPNLSQTLIDNALTASAGGAERARSLLMTAAAKTRGLITQADSKGVTVPITAATNALTQTMQRHVMNSADIQGGIDTLARLENEITAGRGANLTIAEADALKSSLQQGAERAYAAAGRPKSLPVEVLAKRDMAASLNQAI